MARFSVYKRHFRISTFENVIHGRNIRGLVASMQLLQS